MFVKVTHGMNITFVFRQICFVKGYYLCLCIFVEKNLVKFCNPLASKTFFQGGGGGCYIYGHSVCALFYLSFICMYVLTFEERELCYVVLMFIVLFIDWGKSI